MNCPNCNANDFLGPRYGSVPGGRRRSAVVRCRACGSTFDAARMGVRVRAARR